MRSAWRALTCERDVFEVVHRRRVCRTLCYRARPWTHTATTQSSIHPRRGGGDSARARGQLRRDRRAPPACPGVPAWSVACCARRRRRCACPGTACCAGGVTAFRRRPRGARTGRRLAAEGVPMQRGRWPLDRHGWERDLDAALWAPHAPPLGPPSPRRACVVVHRRSARAVFDRAPWRELPHRRNCGAAHYSGRAGR